MKKSSLNRMKIGLSMLLALLIILPASLALGCDSGGGGGGKDGDNPVKDFYSKPGGGGGGTGKGNSWSPPSFMPPPPDGGSHVIDLEIPIRIEPVDTTTNEPVDLVTIGPGIGGHPGSGTTTTGRFVLVDYRDIVSIVYDKDMGWVGISSRWAMKVKLPMTPFIRQIIANSLRGRSN